MAYNLTAIGENSSTVLGFIQGVDNILLFNWLGVMLLLGISIIIFTSLLFRTNDMTASLGATAFISFGLSIMLAAMQLLSAEYLIISLVISGAIVAFSAAKK